MKSPNRLTAFLLFVLLPVCMMTIAWQTTGFVVSLIILALIGWLPFIGTNAARFIGNLMTIAGVIGIIIGLL